MAWTTPGTATAGEVLTAAFWNTNVRDNTEHLYDTMGLTHITTQSVSAQAALSINNCFTSTYDNYRILIDPTGASTALQILMRMRVSGSDSSASNYGYAGVGYRYTGANTQAAGSSGTSWLAIYVRATANTVQSYGVIDLVRPAAAEQTTGTYLTSNGDGTSVFVLAGSMNFSAATAFDGFSLLTNTGTMSATVRVYGYNNG